MEKSELKRIFESEFNHSDWHRVMLDVFSVNTIHQQAIPINLPVNDIAEEAFEIGHSVSSNDRTIGFYEVFLKPNVWIARNRVGLRNLLRSVYKYDVDGALIVFIQDKKWRLSFVSEIKTLSEHNEIVHKETHPKRFTYLLGEGERVRTPLSRINSLSGKTLSLDDFQDAFSVEALNKEFYTDYQRVSKDIIQFIFPRLISNKLKAHQGALNLLNRIIFICFLQKKGWLMNNTDFVFSFWNDYKDLSKNPDSFHEKWINKVFFKAFNGKAFQDPEIFKFLPEKYHKAILDFPFLNGGLFTFNKDYDIFFLPDKFFESIFEFLQRYNFTIIEDSDEEVSLEINPELLGKMYEGMINATDLNDVEAEHGIVYTERPEINFMVRRSFVEVLDKKLRGNYSREFLYHFCFDEHFKKVELLKKYSVDVDVLKNAVLSVTVCDPACGSGSMLLGVIQLQMELIRSLDELIGQIHNPQLDFLLKKQIISESIYGVDIKEWAVRIAELRFWLFMIADAEFSTEELMKTPLLPNLDFKLRQGNSLLQQIGNVDFSIEGLLKGRKKNFGATRKLNEFIKKKKAFITNQSDSDTTFDNLKKEEIRVFRDFIKELIFENHNEIKRLSNGTGQINIPGLEVIDNLFGEQIGKLESENIQLERTLINIKETGRLPFSFDIDFMEVFITRDDPGFDLVIGNPPYVRQEDILPAEDALELERLLKPENKVEKARINKAFKEQLSLKVFQTWPFLSTKAKTQVEGITKTIDIYGKKVPGRSDLYVYFQLLCPSLLNSQGTFCFIISSSWLDVEFGGFIQHFLLKHTQLYAIYDCNVRSFSASVNTVIYLHSAAINTDLKENQYKTYTPNGSVVRFIMNKSNYTEVCYAPLLVEQEHCRENTFRRNYRVIVKKPKDLWEEGYDEENHKYEINKWGGKFLRAPEIYFTLLERGKNKLTPLKEIAEVRFGIKTGANEFFILSREKATSWGIENEFLIPILKSPKECRAIKIDSSKLPNFLFYCHKDKKDLARSNALRYIEWGEESEIIDGKEIRAFHLRPSTKGRRRWWSVDSIFGNTFWGKELRERLSVFYNEEDILADCRLYVSNLSFEQIAYLNSTMSVFIDEVLGRQLGGGGGPRSVMVYEIQNLIVFNASYFSLKKEIRQCFQQLAKREIYGFLNELNIDITQPIRHYEITPLPDRKALDDLIFNEIGLSIEERNEVYWSTAELVKQRLDKAGSR